MTKDPWVPIWVTVYIPIRGRYTDPSAELGFECVIYGSGRSVLDTLRKQRESFVQKLRQWHGWEAGVDKQAAFLRCRHQRDALQFWSGTAGDLAFVSAWTKLRRGFALLQSSMVPGTWPEVGVLLDGLCLT